jgi:hypothetical protein
MKISLQKLIAHVGCGSVDDAGACVYCDLIRQHLRAQIGSGTEAPPKNSDNPRRSEAHD